VFFRVIDGKLWHRVRVRVRVRVQGSGSVEGYEVVPKARPKAEVDTRSVVAPLCRRKESRTRSNSNFEFCK